MIRNKPLPLYLSVSQATADDSQVRVQARGQAGGGGVQLGAEAPERHPARSQAITAGPLQAAQRGRVLVQAVVSGLLIAGSAPPPQSYWGCRASHCWSGLVEGTTTTPVLPPWGAPNEVVIRSRAGRRSWLVDEIQLLLLDVHNAQLLEPQKMGCNSV